MPHGSADERRRIGQHRTRPDRRFHYRYLAAEFAWEASQLLPNDDEDTAYVLWMAGSWLKVRDPEYADRFYKALVRRCRHTPLGAEADRIRWFPTSVPSANEKLAADLPPTQQSLSDENAPTATTPALGDEAAEEVIPPGGP